MKNIKDIFENIPKSLKVKSFKPEVNELTVFIKVSIDNLNASSLFIPEIVNIIDKIDKDKIKIITDKKYL
tara:strand:- start:511 stop:720 length:210 start_codon:yes stop_codon:yes gene_type:complete